MNAAAVELPAKIHRGIPLSQATGCRITHLTARQIAVEAPLGPNINVHGCGSAGGLNAVGILTAWGLGTHIIVSGGLDAELVVAEARVRYSSLCAPRLPAIVRTVLRRSRPSLPS